MAIRPELITKFSKPHNAHVHVATDHYRATQVLRPGWIDRVYGNGECIDPLVLKATGGRKIEGSMFDPLQPTRGNLIELLEYGYRSH
jgi:hypothetical protein